MRGQQLAQPLHLAGVANLWVGEVLEGAWDGVRRASELCAALACRTASAQNVCNEQVVLGVGEKRAKGLC